MRRLLSTRRLVPLDRLDEYLDAWNRLRRTVTGRGGRAWLFRAAAREDHFLEFLEYGDAPALLEQDDVADARESLDTLFREAGADEWEEVEEGVT